MNNESSFKGFLDDLKKYESKKNWEGIIESGESFFKENKGRAQDTEGFSEVILFLISAFRKKGFFEKAFFYSQFLLELFRGKKIKHNEFLKILNETGESALLSGDFNKAEELLTELLEERKKNPKALEELSESYNNLAVLYRKTGRYEDALVMYKKALEIRKVHLSEKKDLLTQSFNNLGILYRNMGNLSDAERAFKEAIDFLVGEDDLQSPLKGLVNSNLGLVYMDLGQYEKAEKLFSIALKNRENIFGKLHPEYFQCLNNIGSLHFKMQNWEKAFDFLEKSYGLCVNLYGESHPISFNAGINYAAGLHKSGEIKKSEQLLEKMKRDFETKYGKEFLLYSYISDNLGYLKYICGNFTEAEELFLQSLKIKEKILGSRHKEFSFSLANLGRLHSSMGNVIQGFEELLTSCQIQTDLFFTIAAAFSESVALDFSETIRDDFYALLSLGVKLSKEKPVYSEKTFEAALKRKSLSLEASISKKFISLYNLYPDQESALRKLNSLKSELAKKLSGEIFSKDKRGESSLIADELEEKCELLERELSLSIPEIALELSIRKASKDEIKSKIPENYVLADFFKYRVFDFEDPSNPWKEERYLVFVLEKGEERPVRIFDLGNAYEIDAGIEKFRKAVERGKESRALEGPCWEGNETSFSDIADEIYNRIFLQVEKFALSENPSLEGFLIAPDSNLARIPFEVFPTQTGEYLIEKYDFCYLNAPRDLARYNRESLSNGRAVVFADPDFDIQKTSGIISEKQDNFLSPAYRSLRESVSGFKKLPGTLEEGKAIERILREKKSIPKDLFLGKSANEKNISLIKRPAILHIATHGFFLSQGDKNPLFRSGIVLSGVNNALKGEKISDEYGDGVLAAFDVQTLDLLGSEIVTLSACETGLGESRIGEGLLGLCRAFQISGAKTVIISLWKVPDNETRMLMEKFYKYLFEGYNKSSALRKSKMDLIEFLEDEYGYSDPWFWAGFICHGENNSFGIGDLGKEQRRTT